MHKLEHSDDYLKKFSSPKQAPVYDDEEYPVRNKDSSISESVVATRNVKFLEASKLPEFLTKILLDELEYGESVYWADVPSKKNQHVFIHV